MKDIHNADLTKRAQSLRKEATKQEKHLWFDYLRTYPVQFKRQVTVDKYIVDFYCAKANLIVELDGSQHYSVEGESYDRKHTAVLEQRGFFVLRFSNNDVDYSFEGVCERIDREVKKRMG